jgi:predicted small lipoprotein YifL
MESTSDLPLNFNIFLLILFVLAGCGVKGDPTFPKDATLPSILEDYPDIKTETPLNETKKK